MSERENYVRVLDTALNLGSKKTLFLSIADFRSDCPEALRRRICRDRNDLKGFIKN